MFTFILHSDPSHSWLEVPIELVLSAAITDDVSEYSYIKFDNGIMKSKCLVFLEEDSDMPKFLNVLKDFGIKWAFDEQHTDDDHWIRQEKPYLASKVRRAILLSYSEMYAGDLANRVYARQTTS
jgi:hypothetical protein